MISSKVEKKSSACSVQVGKFVGVAAEFEVTQEIRRTDDDGGGVVVGVKTQGRLVEQVPVGKEVHVVFRVVDQSEGRHRAGEQPQVAFHPFFGGEGQFALMQPLFQVVDGQVLGAVEDDQVMAVAFLVAEKQILAVHRTVLPPVLLGFFDGGSGRVVVRLERDAVCSEVVVNVLFSGHVAVKWVGYRKIPRFFQYRIIR